MLRDDAPMCPVCNEHALDHLGQRYVCGTCAGALVTEAELHKLAEEAKTWRVKDASIVFSATTVPEPIRTCPRCVTQMTKHDLRGIVIDRCAEHGVWFDGDELRRVLEKLSGVSQLGPTKREHILSGIAMGVWLAINIGLPILLG